jgi:hypothetical protein
MRPTTPELIRQSLIWTPSERETCGVDLPDWVPDSVEVTVPNAARMYDYTLGGYHNFAVDREYIERAEQAMPGIVFPRWATCTRSPRMPHRRTGHANRAFVGRSVR